MSTNLHPRLYPDLYLDLGPMRPLVGYIRTGIGPKWAEYGPLGPHGAQNGRKDRSSQYVYGTCFFVLLPELQKNRLTNA